ncbi:MAG: hypothetical protein ACYC7D_00005 [Nitrososphaerales archaeon]
MRKSISAVLWTSLFSIPMTAPVALQIIYTTGAKLVSRMRSMIGQGSKIIEEFVVTPKSREAKTVRGVLLDLKVEMVIGFTPTFLAIVTGSVWYLAFSMIQVAALISLPMLIASESNVDKLYRVKSHIPISAKEYAQGYRNMPPQGMPQTVSIVAN